MEIDKDLIRLAFYFDRATEGVTSVSGSGPPGLGPGTYATGRNPVTY